MSLRYRITDWNRLFEINRTREMKRMEWVPMPNKMDGSGYTELVDHPNAAAHFGAWCAMVEIASRQKIRGTFPQEGAGIPQALARISRLPAGLFVELIPRLLRMGWIESFQLDGEIPQEGAGIPHDPATIPQEGAASRAPDTRYNTERNGTVEQALVPDTFNRFVEVCTVAEISGSEIDFKAARGHWVLLTIEEQLLAVQGIKERVAGGELADPGFRPLPQNYLRNKIWQRAIREKRDPGTDKTHAKRNEVLQMSKMFTAMRTGTNDDK